MSATARGLAWVFLAGLTLVIFVVIVRFVGSTLHPVQEAFIRYALGILAIAPLFMRCGLVSGTAFVARSETRPASVAPNVLNG